MIEDENASLLARIDQAWLALWTRVEALDDGALRQPAGDSGWPVSVMLAHFGRWEDWHHEAIRDHLRDGSVRAYMGFDGWNEEWASEDRALAPSEARALFGSAHDRLRSLLGDLRPEQWDEHISRWVQGCTFEHYREHIDSLPDSLVQPLS